MDICEDKNDMEKKIKYLLYEYNGFNNMLRASSFNEELKMLSQNGFIVLMYSLRKISPNFFEMRRDILEFDLIYYVSVDIKDKLIRIFSKDLINIPIAYEFSDANRSYYRLKHNPFPFIKMKKNDSLTVHIITDNSASRAVKVHGASYNNSIKNMTKVPLYRSCIDNMIIENESYIFDKKLISKEKPLPEFDI